MSSWDRFGEFVIWGGLRELWCETAKRMLGGLARGWRLGWGEIARERGTCSWGVFGGETRLGVPGIRERLSVIGQLRMASEGQE